MEISIVQLQAGLTLTVKGGVSYRYIYHKYIDLYFNQNYSDTKVDQMKYCLQCNKPKKEEDLHYGQHLSCFQLVFRVSGKPEFFSLIQKDSTTDKKQDHRKTQSSPHLTTYFGGNYRKYEGSLGDAKYILKLSKPDYPELAPVEYVSNKIAFHCGLIIPTPFTLLDMGDGELAFVSRNFMDSPSTHMTLNHIYHYPPLENAVHYTVEDILKTIYRETKSSVDTKIFLHTLIFDALVGNHDRHGRNLALIVSAKNQKLSPIYDNPSYLGLESGAMLKGSFSPRGKVWTKVSREPEMIEYLEEMKRLGVLAVAKDFFQKISIVAIASYIDESNSLSSAMKLAMKKLILKRYQDLEVYLENK